MRTSHFDRALAVYSATARIDETYGTGVPDDIRKAAIEEHAFIMLDPMWSILMERAFQQQCLDEEQGNWDDRTIPDDTTIWDDIPTAPAITATKDDEDVPF